MGISGTRKDMLDWNAMNIAIQATQAGISPQKHMVIQVANMGFSANHLMGTPAMKIDTYKAMLNL